jgi:hypothetical protein
LSGALWIQPVLPSGLRDDLNTAQSVQSNPFFCGLMEKIINASN